MPPKLTPYIQRRKKEIATAKELLIKLEAMINSAEKDIENLDHNLPNLTTHKDIETEVNRIELSYWFVNSELYGLNKIFDRPDVKGKERVEYYLDN